MEVDEDRLLPPLLLLVQLLPLRLLHLPLPLPPPLPPEVEVAEVEVAEVEVAEVEVAEVEVEEAEVEEAASALPRFASRDALPYLGDGGCSNARQ